MKKNKIERVKIYHKFDIDDVVIGVTYDKHVVEGQIKTIQIHKNLAFGNVEITYWIYFYNKKKNNQYDCVWCNEKSVYQNRQELLSNIQTDDLFEMLDGKISSESWEEDIR